MKPRAAGSFASRDELHSTNSNHHRLPDTYRSWPSPRPRWISAVHWIGDVPPIGTLGFGFLGSSRGCLMGTFEALRCGCARLFTLCTQLYHGCGRAPYSATSVVVYLSRATTRSNVRRIIRFALVWLLCLAGFSPSSSIIGVSVNRPNP